MFDSEHMLAVAFEEIAQCHSLNKLAVLKSKLLGKNSELAQQMLKLKTCSHEEKRIRGKVFNSTKNAISAAIEKRGTEIGNEILEEQIQKEYLDATLPALKKVFGKMHPITKTTEEMYTILDDMGYEFVLGPDIESDYNNFTALNIPEHHPARTMHDTFYIKTGELDYRYVLRTHTSAVQVKTLQEKGAPLYIFTIGNAYRNDSDATHTPVFHQIEGMAIDRDINFGHLKWTINEILRRFFGVYELNIRLRPSFFPFTEPSAEFDMSYRKENGCIVFGKGEHWLEMGGCGMVHPKVLENGGIDSKMYQGFAFGMGLERLTSLKYGISDLRQYFEYDKRFEENFYFSHC